MQAYEAFQFLRPIALSEFGEAFDTFTTSAFRLECLTTYLVDEERPFFDSYSRTGSCEEGFNQDWLDFLTTANRKGKSIHRCRILPQPNDDQTYFRFEVDCGYRRNLECGESISYLTRDDASELAAAVPFLLDYWLFDHLNAYAVLYDTRGVFLGAAKMEGELPKIYAALADRAVNIATQIPIEDVLARIR
ncbi:DUF6879 family protein [Pelomonas sp. SE-A7]|uniref:DUF6879 family protein n=1 Tax=Pelomonas sp. SE-A7 TaxID=3054953 RepID=UPI00259D1606|nr:DUF6879 family protein [Pelomonas sp. SE-A7]MDM4767283.1 hypothetical protein [Pelomonas sp. SE-A7]